MPQPKGKQKQIQLKVTFPPHLYAALQQEAKDAAVTMADLVRLAVKERYARQAKAAGPGHTFGSDGDIRRLVQAYQAGRITAQELAERLVVEEQRAYPQEVK